jgi:hypothetical protein
MTSAGSDARPGQAGQPADAGRGAPGPEQAGRPAAARPVPAEPVLPGPVLSEQSREDTDIAWGDYSRGDDEDRLYRDRPPHWADY